MENRGNLIKMPGGKNRGNVKEIPRGKQEMKNS